MEHVKHHVTASGSTTLRGFFASDNVEFDPPSLSLRRNITKAKSRFVHSLADGYTSADDEGDIRDALQGSQDSAELIRLVGVMDGWEGLDDELEPSQVDQVAAQLAQVLDQRHQVLYQLIRRYLVLLDYGASPTLGDCFQCLARWPSAFQDEEIDAVLARRGELLGGITSAARRGRTNVVNAARVLPAVIQGYATGTVHRSDEIVSLMHEVNYSTRICASLVPLDYQPLYRVIADMVDPTVSPSQRQACRDTCLRMSLEFAAAAKAVEVVGSQAARSTVNRFMATLQAALDNFSPTLPAPSTVAAIIAALGGAGSTLTDLLTAVTNLPDALSGAITLPALLGTDDDDNARRLVGELKAQGSLAHLAFTVKVMLINAALDGWTVDDDEIAILGVVQTTKAFDKAEVYQLVAAVTWGALSSGVDGAEYDELVSTLRQPE